MSNKNCAMMGLQATTSAVVGKRKLDVSTELEAPLAKHGKWEISTPTAATPTSIATTTTTTDDCIARLRAVAVPSADVWREPTPSLAATLLTEDEFDDDEFDDELSDEEKCAAMVSPFDTTTIISTTISQVSYTRFQNSDYWQYYQPPQQQTIRCEENGKSYLELGAAPQVKTTTPCCCDGRTRWCHVPCYRQRRLAVLNLSMCKLSRYRQCSDPSLRRSVLICNTLRKLEREIEAESPEPNYHILPEMIPPTRPCLVTETNYEQSLREVACTSGRATPFPAAAGPDTDSGLGDDDAVPINWGSVLSLTSQTDLESLNNNELYAELGLNSCSNSSNSGCSNNNSSCNNNNNNNNTNNNHHQDQEPSDSRTDFLSEWDGFMHVIVGGS